MLYLVVAVVWYIGLRCIRRRVGGVIVLCYHGIKAAQIQRFAWQVRRAAARAVDIKALTNADLPERVAPAICFTFDDAFANLGDNALPILHEHGVPACIFAVSENLGDLPRWSIAPDHPEAQELLVTAAQLQQAVHDGWCALGSHTCTHPDLVAVPLTVAGQELRESRRVLGALAGTPVVDLALPHGSYSPGVIDAALAAGYQKIYTLEPKLHRPANDARVIGRFLMSPDAWRIEFQLTCAGAYTWLHPWRRLLSRLRRGAGDLQRSPVGAAPEARETPA